MSPHLKLIIMIVSCKIKNPNNEVKAGLSLSPAEIDRMTAKGRAAAIGSQEDSVYFDNIPNGADVVFEKRRGVSVNDVWQHSQTARRKISDARDKALSDKIE